MAGMAEYLRSQSQGQRSSRGSIYNPLAAELSMGPLSGIPERQMENNQDSQNSQKTEEYSQSPNNSGFYRMPFLGARGPMPQNLSRNNSAPERRYSLAHRRHVSSDLHSDLLIQPSQEDLQRFYSVAQPSQEDLQRFYSAGPQSQEALERFHTVTQSSVRFVLYTSDPEVMRNFKDGRGVFITNQIQLLYNSSQLVPIDYVLVDDTDPVQVQQIKDKLPQSVQHISQGFGDSQMIKAITTDDYFLLTIEPDIPNSNRPVFGMLCCSFENATRNSADFVDLAGAPLLNFQSVVGDVYVYIHLFTFLSDRATGDEFFTGTHMLEGLYLLFNYDSEDTIIYLEAIDIQATLDFYDRFGMERIVIDPVAQVYFDPFKGFVVPDELPYVLYSHKQMQVASIIAFQARQSRLAGTEARIMALVTGSANAALGLNITPEERQMIERSVSVYNHTRARRDPRPPLP